jgi:hypothetical protein
VGFTVAQSCGPGTDDHLVTVKVHLTLAETNTLFLAGDTLVSWPPAESYSDASASGPEAAPASAGSPGVRGMAPLRTGIFVSELARLAHGIKIGYRQASEAERAAQVLRLQLRRAGIEEEG